MSRYSKKSEDQKCTPKSVSLKTEHHEYIEKSGMAFSTLVQDLIDQIRKSVKPEDFNKFEMEFMVKFKRGGK